MNVLDAIGAASGQAQIAPAAMDVARPAAAESVSFGDMLELGLNHIETRIDRANELVRAFAVDDSVPIHEVTVALEEARLAVELALQVRARLVESYREIMNMQL